MKKILLYLSAFLIVTSCATPRRSLSSSKTSTVREDGTIIYPKFEVFHTDATSSELHFKINSKELLYSRSDGINLSSNVLISYRLSPAFDSKEIVDSSSARLVDINNDNLDKFLIGKINFNAKSPTNNFLFVTVTDLNRNISKTEIIFIQKDNELNRQNFMVRSKDTETLLFRNYVKLGEQVSINYKNRKSGVIYVRYYNRDFPIAAPPFSEIPPKPFQYQEDSLFTLNLSSNGTIDFVAAKKGFYHFQYDSSSHEGCTLFNFTDKFPEIKKAEDMLPPLRYITSKAEFEDLNKATNKKVAIEKFWLNSTSNPDRAREVIKKYYNRVEETNRYFSSYIEGWKTDRGMIYLIFGRPNIRYVYENYETWIYGEEKSVNALSYTFVKVKNPFTTNDYTLERSPFYKQSWFMSVEAWRQGRANLQE